MDKNSDQTLHDDVTTGQTNQIETFHKSSDETSVIFTSPATFVVRSTVKCTANYLSNLL